jgi:hypothetical protein
MKLYRKLQSTVPEPVFTTLDNNFTPMERATAKELKDRLKKASDEMDANPGVASYEAAYKTAERIYQKFLDDAGSSRKKNTVTVYRKR